jgi:hypothetical protein
VWDPEQLDALLATLHERVEERRRAGDYPEGLEERLAEHFSQLTVPEPAPATAMLGPLAAARADLERFEFARATHDDSRIPGGRAAHRLISKAVARDIDDVVEQARRHALAVDRVVAALCDVVTALAASVDGPLAERIGDLQVRSVEERAHLHAVVAQLEELAARAAGAPGES